MCGIAGFWRSANSLDAEELAAHIKKMTQTLNHRGPDDGGSYVEAGAGIGLGHRRLSIIDLSRAGHQPMSSVSGRFVISFNGEIYNYREIRREVERSGPYEWRGHSDTEVLLAAISNWGLETACRRITGMFAFSLWDKKEQTLHLVRDRMGEKPLYYGWMGNLFLFGSELKAFKAHPDFRGVVDRDSVAMLMRFGYVPAPFSIYEEIYKLPPGTILRLDRAVHHAEPVPYWTLAEAAAAGMENPFEGSRYEAIDRLEELLRASVKSQMVADVPLGAFLSGGIDSSTLIALMQQEKSGPVKTFTIGFGETKYNEAAAAKAVAAHLGTDHTELYVTPREAREVITRLPSMYDEPFADSSQIPTFLVSRLARTQVAVSLSGDGGDELFAGYNRYFWCRRLNGVTGRAPAWLLRGAAQSLMLLAPDHWDVIFRRMKFITPRRLRVSLPGDKIHKLAGILPARDPGETYGLLTSHWRDPQALVTGSAEPPAPNAGKPTGEIGFIEQMLYLDGISYLPDDILVKVDRASMSVSLESRMPFLNHELVEFAWSLPLEMKIRNDRGKWILRQILNKYIPEKLFDRPKMGFGIPIDLWLRGPLRNWAESLLSERRLRDEGFFDPAMVQQKWREHLGGHRNWQGPLWNVLMFQSWLESA